MVKETGKQLARNLCFLGHLLSVTIPNHGKKTNANRNFVLPGDGLDNIQNENIYLSLY